MNKTVKTLAQTLVFLAFFIQTLIPAGFMVNLDSANATPLVICSGMDMKTIYVDHNGKPVDKKSTADDHAKPCVSAALNTTPAAQSIFVSTPVTFVTASIPVPEYGNIHTPAFYERPPAIGPPALI